MKHCNIIFKFSSKMETPTESYVRCTKFLLWNVIFIFQLDMPHFT